MGGDICWRATAYIARHAGRARNRLSHCEHPPHPAAHVDAICRGAYPWERSATSPAASSQPAAQDIPTVEQLITQLQRHSNELQRAAEELQLLAEERTRCLQYLQRQQAAISAALQRTVERCAALQAGGTAPPCSSLAARQPTTVNGRQQEVQYCEGLAVLLRERLEKATAQLAAARQAFASAGGSSAEAADSDSMFDLIDEYDEEDEEM